MAVVDDERRRCATRFGHLRDGEELAPLEAAAKSRSEADWIVGMNATRAATIRLRSSFDGAVSLGRVQTPTLAILARREEEIRAFKPEKYWLVDARFEADGARRYEGRFHAGAQPRLKSAEEAEAIVAAVRGERGEITKLDKTKRKERAPLLYDLTSLQREANTRFGFSARRTLAAAQRCYEEHKALTYPRTSSRYLTSDMVPEIKPTAGQRRPRAPSTREAAEYVTALDLLPLGARRRRREGRRPPRDHPDELRARRSTKMNDDDRRVYDLVARRFLAVFHPEAVFENTRVETTVAEHVFRTRGRVLLVPGWRGVYGELSEGERARRRGRGRATSSSRASSSGEAGRHARGRGAREGDQAAAALHRRVAARRDGDRGQARRRRRAARGDEGLGHRHAGDARGDHRAPHRRRLRRARRPRARRHREGPERHPPARRAPADLARADRRLGAPPGRDRARRGARASASWSDIAKFAGETVGALDATLKDVRIPRANLGPVPGLRQRHRREPQGLLVLVARGPGLRLRHLEVARRASSCRPPSRAS